MTCACSKIGNQVLSQQTFDTEQKPVTFRNQGLLARLLFL